MANIYYRKLARRRHDDIAVVNGCCNFDVQGGEIKKAQVVFGCLDLKTVHMPELEKVLTGFKLDGGVEQMVEQIK